MQAQWFSNLSKSEQEEFKKLVLGSQKVLDRLHEICYNTIKNGELTKESDYDSPSWHFKQADKNGYLRAYREIMKLCELKQP